MSRMSSEDGWVNTLKKRKATTRAKKSKISSSSQSQRRRVKGSLERLTDMPFDILLEVGVL